MSTPEDNVIDRVLSLTPNFSKILQAGDLEQGGQEPGVEKAADEALGEINPIDQIVFAAKSGQFQPEEIVSAQDRFTRGFIKGTVASLQSPFELITGQDFKDPFEGEDLGTAGKIGDIASFGLAFIPALGVTRVTRLARPLEAAVGLIRPLATKARAISEGAVAFGLFEGSKADSLKDFPKEFAKQTGVGLAFEISLLGAAKGFRRLFVKKAGENVVPEALAVEELIHPNNAKETDEVVLKIAGINKNEPVLMTASELAHELNPGGGLITDLPVTGGASKLIRQLKERLPEEYSFDVHIDKETKRLQLLVHDDRPRTSIIAEKIVPITSSQDAKKFTLKFLSDEGMPLTGAEIRSIYEKELAGEFVPSVKVTVQKTLDARTTSGEIVNAFARTGLPESQAEIILGKRIATLADDQALAAVLTHEYTHWLGQVISRNFLRSISPTGEISAGRVLIDIADIVEPFLPKDKLKRLEVLETVNRELKEATIEAESRFATSQLMQGKGKPRTIIFKRKSRERAITLVESDANYYGNPSEQLSRLAELMFLAPGRAKAIAPTITDLFAKVIQKESPKLELTMSRRVRLTGELLGQKFKRGGPEFGEVSQPLTTANRLQFRREGFYEGQSVIYNGQEGYQYLAKAGEKKIKIIDPLTNKVKLVNKTSVSQHTIPTLVKRNQRIASAIVRTIERSPDWLGTTILRTEGESTTVHRAMVALDNFVRVKVEKGAGGLTKWIREQSIESLSKEERAGLRAIKDGGERERATIGKILDNQKKPGVIIEDNGSYRMFVRDVNTVQFGEEIPIGFGPKPDGAFNLGEDLFEIRPSWDNTARSILAEAGVADREMPYFLEQLRMQHQKLLTELLDTESVAAFRRSAEMANEAVDGSFEFAARAGLQVEKVNGKFVIRDARDPNQILAKFDHFEDVDEFSAKSMSGIADELDGGSQVPSKLASGGNNGGGVEGPRLNEPMPIGPEVGRSSSRAGKLLERGADIGNNILGMPVTSFRFAIQALERQGFGPLTDIFEKVQKAFRDVSFERNLKLKELGNASFDSKLDLIARLNKRVKPERRELIIDFIESLSKDEVAATGGFSVRGANDLELRISQQLQDLGLGDDGYRVLANRRQVKTDARNLSRLPENKDVDKAELLKRALADSPFDEDMKSMIGVFDDLIKLGPDNFSSAMVVKHAAAPDLPPGFKTLRDWFKKEHKLDATELKLAKEMEDVFDTAFGRSGLNARRQIGGYIPHLRESVKHGLTDADWLRDLPNSNWVSRMLRTGELALYERDPFTVALKHVRGMLINKHYGPIQKEINQAINGVIKDGERVGGIENPQVRKIMNEHIQELLGKPHESFNRLDNLFKRTHLAWTGRELDDGFSRQLVNKLTSFVGGSLLAYRPALIARQYVEVVQKIAPRLGFSDMFAGIRAATVDPAAKEATIRAGALIPAQRRLPLGIGDIEPGTFTGRASGKFNEFIDFGLVQYRKGDDWARVVAFDAQRRRIVREYTPFRKGKISKAQFEQNARITTFDPVDVAKFWEMYADGSGFMEATSFLSRIASEEMIGRFGLANHPVGWGGVTGKLFGQFGTWPVQYKDFLVAGVTRGTAQDKIRFATTTAAVNMGTLGAFASVGLDGRGWVGYPSLSYTGGPFLDMTVDLVRMRSGTKAEKSMARKNLRRVFPTFDDPRSIFLPGSFAVHDIVSTFQREPKEFGQEAFGFRSLPPDLTAFELVFGDRD